MFWTLFFAFIAAALAIRFMPAIISALAYVFTNRKLWAFAYKCAVVLVVAYLAAAAVIEVVNIIEDGGFSYPLYEIPLLAADIGLLALFSCKRKAFLNAKAAE